VVVRLVGKPPSWKTSILPRKLIESTGSCGGLLVTKRKKSDGRPKSDLVPSLVPEVPASDIGGRSVREEIVRVRRALGILLR